MHAHLVHVEIWLQQVRCETYMSIQVVNERTILARVCANQSRVLNRESAFRPDSLQS